MVHPTSGSGGVPASGDRHQESASASTQTGPAKAQAVDAFASSVNWKKGSCATTDGLKLATHTWLPEGAPKGVLVIVHGLKDHASNYKAIAEALTQQGFAVYAFDLRGHGESEGERVVIKSFNDYTSDLAELMASVQKNHQTLKPFLFGHSMGGAIAMQYALQNKPELSGLLLSGAALLPNDTFMEKTSSAFARRCGDSFLGSLPLFKLSDDKFSRDPKVVKAMKTDPLVLHKGAPLHTAREILITQDAIHAHAAELMIPLLAMHGGADQITNPRGSKQLVAEVKAGGLQDATFVEYPGDYHNLLHEPDRAKIEADIIAWLKSH
jgi:acylglycerol lipase